MDKSLAARTGGHSSDRKISLEMAGLGGRTANFLSHMVIHRKRLLLGFLLITFFTFSAAFAPLLTGADPLEQNLSLALNSPTAQHPLGSDELGRDLFSRILYGGRVTLGASMVALAISSVVGNALGLAAGYAGGRVDNVCMRIIDVQMAFPGIILAIAVIAVVGQNLLGLIISLSLYPIPAFARLSRATTLVIMGQEYIEAARAVGVGHSGIIFRHILPNTIGPLLVQASLSIAGIILVGSSLGFLGLGVPPPTPEWGALLSRGRDYVVSAPHMGVFPGLAVALVVLGFGLVGDGLRDLLDPRLRKLEA